MESANNKILLEVKTTRTEEETAEATLQFLASLVNLKKPLLYFWRLGVPISFEIAVFGQTIHYYICVEKAYQTFVEGQLVAQYPKAIIAKAKDFTKELFARSTTVSLGQMKLSFGFLYPLRTFKDFKEVDPLSSLLGTLSKAKEEDMAVVQFLLVPVSSSWQGAGEHAALDKKTDSAGSAITNPYTAVIKEKIAFNGFKTAIRLAVSSDSKERSKHFLFEIANSFSSFNNPSGNSLRFKRPILWQRERLIKAIQTRSKHFVPMSQILNVEELSTMFHFPTLKLANIPNISWYKTILSQPPEELPISEGLSDDQKKEVNFFAKTEFKNKMSTFGIKTDDRRKHVYVIGKTGTGKSTLIANMAINDMRNGKGFAVIDPHGDLCEILLQYVPSYRVNDVIYLDPSDRDHHFSMNPLEVESPHQKELVVSGIVSIFHKLYGTSWGPRLEYILRNALLSVIGMPNANLLMVTDILTNDSFRQKVVDSLDDVVLKNYWTNEFANMTDRLKAESLSPVLNKVGQFTSSHLMRNIIKDPKSTVNLEKIMNEGKILLFNVSQGKIGEDNAALLGAIAITKIQLAAMNRVHLAETDRRDFYLYVDEFQNFATSSFIKILSEARKYRLNLILANQYITQIPEDVRGAIFGNAGTMLSFIIGAQDSPYMAKEFGERFKEEDLLALGNYQAIIKLAIDGITHAPFLCYTLPLPKSATQNREKILKSSIERYTKPVKD